MLGGRSRSLALADRASASAVATAPQAAWSRPSRRQQEAAAVPRLCGAPALRCPDSASSAAFSSTPRPPVCNFAPPTPTLTLSHVFRRCPWGQGGGGFLCCFLLTVLGLHASASSHPEVTSCPRHRVLAPVLLCPVADGDLRHEVPSVTPLILSKVRSSLDAGSVSKRE